MKIALITGSCGLVGSESSIFFDKKNFKIIGIDNNSRKSFFGKDGDISWVKNNLKRNLKHYNHLNIDIRNFNALKKVFLRYKKNIKIIIHTAAQPSHDWAKKFIAGNIKNEKIIDIWLNKKFQKARDNLLNSKRNFSPCNKCDVSGELIGSYHAKKWLQKL